MSTARRRAATAVALCALLGPSLGTLLGACSLSGDEQSAADSLASVIGRDNAPKSVADSADCVAEKWVGEVGTDVLVADSLVTADFQPQSELVTQTLAGARPVSRETAEGYAAAWVSCVDFDLMSLDQKTTYPGASAQELDAYADCLKDIDDELWRDATADRLAGDTQSNASIGLTRETGACLSALNEAASS